eukprot:5300648-Amphidinium_carterae.1
MLVLRTDSKHSAARRERVHWAIGMRSRRRRVDSVCFRAWTLHPCKKKIPKRTKCTTFLVPIAQKFQTKLILYFGAVVA